MQESLFNTEDLFATLPIREHTATAGPTYQEVISPDELRDPLQIARKLKLLDWAFTAHDTSYLTHDIHPYPAKFIPQIPGHLIAHLSLPGELVLDPFGGSGTTALEAVRLKRRALSIDANPISAIIGRVKTAKLDKRTITEVHAIRSYLVDWLPNLPTNPGDLIEAFATFIPDIPNRSKWFSDVSCGELALIRSRIEKSESPIARDITYLVLSRVVLKASNQDSETRYTSVVKTIQRGETIRRFVQELDWVLLRILQTEASTRYGVINFITGDTRNLDKEQLQNESVDLIVTSPPYANAFDYHLYHRFRLLWLGFNPKDLANIEIGSHLRHQREKNSFEQYLAEMGSCLDRLAWLLKPGRYAAMVIGDAIYNGQLYEGAESVAEVATQSGFQTVCILERQIHRTKRSITTAGRRADVEKILVLQKPPRQLSIALVPPPYKLWEYETHLRRKEIAKVLSSDVIEEGDRLVVHTDPYNAIKARRLTFSHAIDNQQGHKYPTWQAILENGLATVKSSRKDPKYVTHGLHPYKGKFYPQLAKSLINISNVSPGATVLDPFCGSGTTLLESYLNGLEAVGCDMNPLAARVARAKVGVLEIEPSVVSESVATLLTKLEEAPSQFAFELEQFHEDTIEEILRWFPESVIAKMNWLLRTIRSMSASTLRDLFEVLMSSIIREVSQQDPADLRIRRRVEPIKDADVLGLFKDRLVTQYSRIEKYWSVLGFCPYRLVKARAYNSDSRSWESFAGIGLDQNSIDLILTSPPYATALPYIDTDRLSILVLDGLTSSRRRPLEYGLIGSREITPRDRTSLEDQLMSDNSNIPADITQFISSLHSDMLRGDVGFRRRNVPALLLRFFTDMRLVFSNCRKVLKPGGECMIVIGDNTTTIGDEIKRIPTVDFVQLIAEDLGLELVERIPITVTTENLVHMRNAITENVVLRMRAN